MGRELIIYDEVGVCRVGAAFCPSPRAATARDPHVSFAPSLWSHEPKMLLLGGFAVWRCLSSWRSEWLCLGVYRYQKLMSVHCMLHFVLQLPTTSPIGPALLQQLPKISSMAPALLPRSSTPPNFSHPPCPASRGLRPPKPHHGPCPALSEQFNFVIRCRGGAAR